jgi:hypothetical protein
MQALSVDNEESAKKQGQTPQVLPE